MAIVLMRKTGFAWPSNPYGITDPKGNPCCLRESVERLPTRPRCTKVRARSANVGSATSGWLLAAPEPACLPAASDDIPVLLCGFGTRAGAPKRSLLTMGTKRGSAQIRLKDAQLLGGSFLRLRFHFCPAFFHSFRDLGSPFRRQHALLRIGDVSTCRLAQSLGGRLQTNQIMLQLGQLLFYLLLFTSDCCQYAHGSSENNLHETSR